jgi:hypothetical protein
MAQAPIRKGVCCLFVDAGFGGLVSPFLLGFRSDPLFVWLSAVRLVVSFCWGT